MFGNFIFSNFEETSQNSETITKKLEDTSNPPSLEDLLILDGIVEELQNKNKNLINFFTKEKIKQMLDYIIKEPKIEDHNTGHKFPFVCSKLFNIEEKNIMKYFFKTNKELSQEKILENNLSQNKEEKNKEINMNIDNNEDDIAQYYKLNNKENFEDDNFDEVNIDEVNINIKEENFSDNIENGGIKENNKEDNDEDNVNCFDNGDNKENYEHKENDKDINNEDNFNEFDINKNIKEDEDDLVNHIENEDNNDKNNMDNINNGKEEIVNGGIINEKEEDKRNEDRYDNFNDEDDLINIQDDNDIKEKNGENKENNDEIKIEEKKEENKEDSKMQEKEEIKPNGEIIENNQEDNIELLDYFLSFVLTDSELNYVLCGYFSSLMAILLDNDYIKIINYIFFQKKEVLKKLVYHSYRKSIAETLYKIINYDVKLTDYNLEEEEYDKEIDLKKLSEIRLEIVTNIFDTIDINMDSEKLSSMSFLIQDLTKNKNIFNSILNNSYIINSLITKQLNELNLSTSNNVMNIFDQKNNFITIIDIIILWLNTIKDSDMQTPMLLYEVAEDSDEDTVQQKSSPKPELHHTLLSQALVDILPNLIKNNFNENKSQEKEIIQSFGDEKLIPLGFHRIKLVELITNIIHYFRNIPNEFDNIIIKTDFISNAINYIFKYVNNNLYQEALLQFFKALFKKEVDCPEHELLYKYIFSEFNILEKIKINFPKNQKEGNTGIGYAPFLVSLSYKINTVIGGAPLNSDKNYIKQGSITFQTRGRNPKLSGIHLSFNIKSENEKEEKEEIKYNSYTFQSLEKYCNEEWKYFFNEKIANKIILYENYLVDVKESSLNKEDDLFYNPINDNENEEIGNKRYYNKNINNLEIEDSDNKINMANYKDMEININDFNFEDKEENNNGNEDKEKNEFNFVNYWKNDLEKEKNSYVNTLGEEAMKDLLEE